MGQDSPAALPVVRHTITREFEDGTLGVRIIVAAEDVAAFYAMLPEPGAAAFLACDAGAIEVVRDVLLGEYRDGSLSVRLLIHPKFKARFRELWPRPQSAAVLAREDPDHGRQAMLDAALEEPARYGQHARALRTHVAFMGNPAVWRAVGTDEEYLAWLRTEPCAHCGWVPRVELNDTVQCEAAHVRRVGEGFGTSYRAPTYSAISLCHACHSKQHQHGESALGGKEWCDRTRLKQVMEWVWVTLKGQLGYPHWSQCPPATLLAWAQEHELVDCLPECYRNSS